VPCTVYTRIGLVDLGARALRSAQRIAATRVHKRLSTTATLEGTRWNRDTGQSSGTLQRCAGGWI